MITQLVKNMVRLAIKPATGKKKKKANKQTKNLSLYIDFCLLMQHTFKYHYNMMKTSFASFKGSPSQNVLFIVINFDLAFLYEMEMPDSVSFTHASPFTMLNTEFLTIPYETRLTVHLS